MCVLSRHCPEGSGRPGGGPGSELRTCDGLEEVSVILKVVVAVIVVGSFAEGPALLVRHEVLLQRRLEVGHGFLRLLLRVEPHSQPELVLLGGSSTQTQATASPPRLSTRAHISRASRVMGAKGGCHIVKAFCKLS